MYRGLTLHCITLQKSRKGAWSPVKQSFRHRAWPRARHLPRVSLCSRAGTLWPPLLWPCGTSDGLVEWHFFVLQPGHRELHQPLAWGGRCVEESRACTAPLGRDMGPVLQGPLHGTRQGNVPVIDTKKRAVHCSVVYWKVKFNRWNNIWCSVQCVLCSPGKCSAVHYS